MSFHVLPVYDITCHVKSCYAIWCHVMYCHVISCHIVYQVTSCHCMSCNCCVPIPAVYKKKRGPQPTAMESNDSSCGDREGRRLPNVTSIRRDISSWRDRDLLNQRVHCRDDIQFVPGTSRHRFFSGRNIPAGRYLMNCIGQLWRQTSTKVN